jgi:hypothetical protein
MLADTTIPAVAVGEHGPIFRKKSPENTPEAGATFLDTFPNFGPPGLV